MVISGGYVGNHETKKQKKNKKISKQLPVDKC